MAKPTKRRPFPIDLICFHEILTFLSEEFCVDSVYIAKELGLHYKKIDYWMNGVEFPQEVYFDYLVEKFKIKEFLNSDNFKKVALSWILKNFSPYNIMLSIFLMLRYELNNTKDMKYINFSKMFSPAQQITKNKQGIIRNSLFRNRNNGDFNYD